ncbi:MAG: SpoIIE family protein phosphatase [SAR324 cluster bacterium]|nr:SpoIIE family protein phosphatase [SAR324 cluster bacterium]
MNINESSAVNILLVDDQPDNMFLLETMLRQPNRVFVKASSGRAALKMLKEHEFCLVLLDVQMPDMDGFETAALIRDTEDGKHLPIIFVTAYSMTEQHIFLGYKTGAVDYLFKPIHPGILRSKVNVFIEMYQQKQKVIEKSTELEQAFNTQQALNQDLNRRTAELDLAKLQLEEAYQSLQNLNQQMIYDLEQAQKTQRTLLPRKNLEFPGLEIAAKYKPVQQIGGDFYDIYELKNNKIGILLVDVTGHDISSALISFMVAALFKTFAYEHGEMTALIDQVDALLHASTPGSRFASAFYCIYDTKSQHLEYICCGSPAGYIVRAETQEITKLTLGGPPLGAFLTKKKGYESDFVQLNPGDRILLYTDGILEARNANGKIFGKESMISFLKENHQLSLTDLLEALYSYVLSYSDTNHFKDDITLVGLDITQPL